MSKVMGGFRVTPSSRYYHYRDIPDVDRFDAVCCTYYGDPWDEVYEVRDSGLEWLDEDDIVVEVGPLVRPGKRYALRKDTRRDPVIHAKVCRKYPGRHEYKRKLSWFTKYTYNYPNFRRSKRDRKRERLRQERAARDPHRVELFGYVLADAFYDQLRRASSVLGVDMVTFIEEVLGAYRNQGGTTSDETTDTG
jgi:hypothetical protein